MSQTIRFTRQQLLFIHRLAFVYFIWGDHGKRKTMWTFHEMRKAVGLRYAGHLIE